MRRLPLLIGAIGVVLALVAIGLVAGVVLRPHRHAALVLWCGVPGCRQVAAAFTRQTGTKVRAVPVPDAAFAAAIAGGGHPPFSLAWLRGATAAVALDRRGLLAHGLAAPAGLAGQGNGLMPGDGAYVPTGITLAGVFVGAASPLLTMPTRWSDLTRPAYRGAVGMADPALSDLGYEALAGMIEAAGGWPAGKSFVTRLAADGLRLYRSDADVLSALRSGAIKVAIVPAATAFRYRAGVDHTLRIVVPRPAYRAAEVIAMAKGLSGRTAQAARRFVAFAASPPALTVRLAHGDAAWPVVEAAPRKAPRIQGLPSRKTLDIAPLDPDIWGARRHAVLAWFERSIAGNGP